MNYCCSKELTMKENDLSNYLEKWDCDFVSIDDYLFEI